MNREFGRKIKCPRGGFPFSKPLPSPLRQDRLQIGADAMTPVVTVSRMSPRRGENREDSGGRQ